MKKRPPKDPAKAARWRARLEANGELKRAIAVWRFGSQGAASEVRHIDPASYIPQETTKLESPPSQAELAARAVRTLAQKQAEGRAAAQRGIAIKRARKEKERAQRNKPWRDNATVWTVDEQLAFVDAKPSVF